MQSAFSKNKKEALFSPRLQKRSDERKMAPGIGQLRKASSKSPRNSARRQSSLESLGEPGSAEKEKAVTPDVVAARVDAILQASGSKTSKRSGSKEKPKMGSKRSAGSMHEDREMTKNVS